MKTPLIPRQKHVGEYIIRLVHAPSENHEAHIIVLAPVTKRWHGRGPFTNRVKIDGITYWDQYAATYRFYADALREYEGSTSVTKMNKYFDNSLE